MPVLVDAPQPGAQAAGQGGVIQCDGAGEAIFGDEEGLASDEDVTGAGDGGGIGGARVDRVKFGNPGALRLIFRL